MNSSPLLRAVLEAHGFAEVPGDAEIDGMSEEEKRELYKRQRDLISDYRVKARQEVEALKRSADEAMRRAKEMGVPIGDLTQQMTQSMPGAIVLEEPAAPPVQPVQPVSEGLPELKPVEMRPAKRKAAEPKPVEMKPVEPSPLVEEPRARRLRRPLEPAVPPLTTRSYNFTYVDRRLRVINREIAMISKRVKALDSVRYRRKPCR